MSEPLHVIVESREEYAARNRFELKAGIQLIWWILVSAFISYFMVGYFLPTRLWVGNYIFIAYMAMFILSNYFLKGKIQSYVKLVIGITYFIIGILFVITLIYGAITGRVDEQLFVFFLIVIGVFMFLAYNNINKHTNLITVLKQKLFRR